MTAGAAEDVVVVRLVGFPLGLYERAREHSEELLREFALFALRPPQQDVGHDVPQRLLTLVSELTTTYAEAAAGANAVRDAALARGEPAVDLAYEVPVSAAQPLRRLQTMFDEADEFCRRGEHLLTLAAPPDVSRFRCWYFSEFLGQIEERREPRPWPAYEGACEAG